MSSYFVTGATGFLGRRLVSRLLARPDCDTVHVLVRSLEKFDAVARDWDRGRVVAVTGDLTAPGLGVSLSDIPDTIDHVVHLGAVYDFTAPLAVNEAVNVTGTRHVIEFAGLAGAKWLHHISSVAVAGDHRGRFTEQDFDLGQRLPSPYHATKFAAEQLVREQKTVSWRVYRPAAVVGDSRTGEMDKIDGPYYFLPAITRMARLPARLPLVAPHLGATNIVPVDYVVDAIAHLMHEEASSGATYHLGAARNQTLTEVYNAFAGPAGAPKIVASPRVPALVRSGRLAGRLAAQAVDRLPGGRQARSSVLTELGIPLEVLPHMVLEPQFDTTATAAALPGIPLPELTSYAPRLLRYWSEHLDPYRARRPIAPSDPLAGRRILITGASSGIGRATAHAVARRGALVLLVARREEELNEVRSEITEAGGSAWVYPCDLTDAAAVDALVKQVLSEHPAVDMLVNNAGRSIRRSVLLSVDRMHDYERTMALNYFAPLRLTLGLLPHMRERRFGHVVTVTTMGLQSDTPRFSAYLASKAAIEEFGRVAGRETLADGITFTSVRMPLVRTPMIETTNAYRAAPAMSPARAADMVVKALVNRPESQNRPEGVALEVARMTAPRTSRRTANLLYRMMPETAPEARTRRQPPLASIAGTLTRMIWRKL